MSHSNIFLYFFALFTKEGFLISPCYSLKLRNQDSDEHACKTSLFIPDVPHKIQIQAGHPTLQPSRGYPQTTKLPSHKSSEMSPSLQVSWHSRLLRRGTTFPRTATPAQQLLAAMGICLRG